MGNSITNENNSIFSRDVPLFTLDGTICQARVVDVHDGDTLSIVMEIDQRIVACKVRLFGIDTPEISPPLKQRNREKIVQKAKMARNALIRMVTDVEIATDDETSSHISCTANTRVVTVHCMGIDKYGRQLMKLLANDVDVANWLIENKFGTAYDGGSKDLPGQKKRQRTARSKNCSQ